jgi:probable HAF family extracellular repeat protein
MSDCSSEEATEPSSTGADINSAGHVVGRTGSDTGDAGFIFIDGSLQVLGTPGSFSSPTALNDNGQIAGSVSNAGALYVDGAWQLAGVKTIVDINNNGQYTGQNSTHAYIYSGGLVTSLGPKFGTAWSSANAISESGIVVGWARTEDNPVDPVVEGFIYENNSVSFIDPPAGGGYARPYDVNDSRQVVGYFPSASGDSHAFYYDNGAIQDVGTLGGRTSTLDGINAAGDAVGSSINVDFDSRATLYTDGKLYDLNYLVEQGYKGGFRDLIAAREINDNGDIVGVGTICIRCGGNDTRAFLAIRQPGPEPVEISIESPLHPNHDGSESAVAGLNDVIPTVIYGSSVAYGDPEDFMVDQIDPATVSLDSAFGSRGSISAPMLDVDVDEDGNMDAQFEFLTGDTDIGCWENHMAITGETYAGLEFEGETSVTTECNAECH